MFVGASQSPGNGYFALSWRRGFVVLGRSHYQGRCPWLSYSAPSGRDETGGSFCFPLKINSYGFPESRGPVFCSFGAHLDLCSGGSPYCLEHSTGLPNFCSVGAHLPEGQTDGSPVQGAGARDIHRSIRCLKGSDRFCQFPGHGYCLLGVPNHRAMVILPFQGGGYGLGRLHYQGRCPWLSRFAPSGRDEMGGFFCFSWKIHMVFLNPGGQYSAPSGRVWIYALEGLPIARNIPLGYLIFAPLGCICPKGKNRAAPCRARGHMIPTDNPSAA